MRGYFKVPTGSSAKINIADDGATTGISNVTVKKADSNVYDLQGQRVGNSLEGLPSGIYIMNGNKIIVK
jgi:hypothetical protein